MFSAHLGSFATLYVGALKVDFIAFNADILG